MKPYLKVISQGKYGPVTMKPNHPQHLPFFWLKK